MNTLWLLMAQYGGKPFISLEDVSRDFFKLEPRVLQRKIDAGEIALPLTRMERSMKSAKAISLQDLAEYLDARRAAAVKECQQLQR